MIHFGLSQSPYAAEVPVRDTVFHEFSHAAAIDINMVDPVEPGCGSEEWHTRRSIGEAWAMYSASVMAGHETFWGYGNQVETSQSWHYPTNWSSAHEHANGVGIGSMFVSIHSTQGMGAYASILHSAERETCMTVLAQDGFWDDDSNGDGYLTVDDLPENSLYRHVLEADADIYPSWDEHATEISRAFHRYIREEFSGAFARYPWKDRVENSPERAPIVPLEMPENQREIYIKYGPDAGGTGQPLAFYPTYYPETVDMARLGLDYLADGGMSTDTDQFVFWARAGEYYQVETTIPFGSTDTIVDIVDADQPVGPLEQCGINGAEPCTDDDSGIGEGSLLHFYPEQTGWYAISVRPYYYCDIQTGECFGEINVGPGCWYELALRIVGDEYGDMWSEANPIPLMPEDRMGTIDVPLDKDWFYLFVPKAGTLTYSICSEGQDAVQFPVFELYDGGIQQLPGSTLTNANCAAPESTYELTEPGVYFVRISSGGHDDFGTYKFRMDMVDAELENDSELEAFDLDNLFDSTPSPVLATRFESTEDEEWFSFFMEAGEMATVATLLLKTTEDTQIELFAPLDIISPLGNMYQWGPMLTDDDGGYDLWDFSPGYQKASRISFVAPVTGTYKLRVIIGSGDMKRFGLVLRKSGTEPIHAPPFP